MRQLLYTLLITLVALLLASTFELGRTQAQSPYVVVETAATVTGCAASSGTPAPVVLCVTADSHAAVAGDGKTFTELGGGIAAPAITINGTTKTLPATFTISAGVPGVTINSITPQGAATAPAITAQ